MFSQTHPSTTPSSLPGASSSRSHAAPGPHVDPASHHPCASASSHDLVSREPSCQLQPVNLSEPFQRSTTTVANTGPSNVQAPTLPELTFSSPSLDSAQPSFSTNSTPKNTHERYWPSKDVEHALPTPSPCPSAPLDPVAALLMDKNDRPARHARGSSIDTIHDRMQANANVAVQMQTRTQRPVPENSLQHQRQPQPSPQQQHLHHHHHHQQQHQREQEKEQKQEQTESPRPLSCPSPQNRYRRRSLGSMDIQTANMDLRLADPPRPVIHSHHSSISAPACSTLGLAAPASPNGHNPSATSLHSVTSQSPTPKKRFYASNKAPGVDIDQPSLSPSPPTMSNVPAPSQLPAEDVVSTGSSQAQMTKNDITPMPSALLNTPTGSPSPATALTPDPLAQQTKSRRSRLRRALSFAPHSADIASSSLVDHDQGSSSSIGEDIYSSRQLGRGDQNSISSTASSASFVLRKMGNSVRTKSRSIAGLFRTKSSARKKGGFMEDDGFIVEKSNGSSFGNRTLASSLERFDIIGGSTSHIPNLSVDETTVQNSLPNKAAANSPNGNTRGRVIGDDQERADVLAALGAPQPSPSPTSQTPTRGILKHTQYPSNGQRYDFSPPRLSISIDNPTPPSSEPSTPNSKQDAGVLARQPVPSPPADSPGPNFVGATTTLTTSPSGKRLNWNNKIQLYDTWCAGDYDRRGDSPTTARLTPMLAARIREELNTFKMEMEVHESSKGFTHFF